MRSTLEESRSLPSGLAIVSQMDSLLKGPRVLGLISLLGRILEFIHWAIPVCLARSISGYCRNYHNSPGCLSFDLADRLKDQSPLGKDDLHLPRSQSLLCS